jgi:hypothetical protein
MPVITANLCEYGRTAEALVQLTFEGCRGEGTIYPKLVIDLSAKTFVKTPPVSVAPYYLSLQARLDIARPKDADKVIAVGQVRLPLPMWNHLSDSHFSFEGALNAVAMKMIEDNLREDYLGPYLDITGFGMFHEESSRRLIQFDKTVMGRIPLSKLDWLRNVLEPIGYKEYFFVAIPVPRPPVREAFLSALQYLDKANNAFFQGVDSGVFAHCYSAWDPTIYSQREQILSAFDEPNKKCAVEDIVKAIHRFANGGRHPPEQRREQGGFEVNHTDAEFLRILVIAGLAYIGKSQPESK